VLPRVNQVKLTRRNPIQESLGTVPEMHSDLGSNGVPGEQGEEESPLVRLTSGDPETPGQSPSTGNHPEHIPQHSCAPGSASPVATILALPAHQQRVAAVRLEALRQERRMQPHPRYSVGDPAAPGSSP
jgi:hypothetical protein